MTASPYARGWRRQHFWLVNGGVSFCSEFRVYAALEPPEGGTPNFKLRHYRNGGGAIPGPLFVRHPFRDCPNLMFPLEKATE